MVAAMDVHGFPRHPIRSSVGAQGIPRRRTWASTVHDTAQQENLSSCRGAMVYIIEHFGGSLW